MINRRKLLAALCAGTLVAPIDLRAQSPNKPVRIGFLGAGSMVGSAEWVEALRSGLRDLGYQEGRNLFIEFRWAEGKYDRLPDLATALVQSKVDVLVTHGTPGTLAAKAATKTIPIIMAASGDPVGTGLIASLARPGGNVTGSTFFDVEIGAKRLELLRETLPNTRRIAALLNSGNTVNANMLQAMEVTAKSLKMEVIPCPVRSVGEFDSVFSGMSRQRIDAINIHQEVLFSSNAKILAELAARERLPSIGFVGLAEAGGLMAYGVNFPALFRRAATFVDRVLNGARPSDLPVERATTFEFHLNSKTARMLGIRIPPSIAVRADKIIE